MDPRFKVYTAGICSLLLTIGIARFAYTPLLPVMLDQTSLTLSWGGWLAAFNYSGYLIGAFIAARIRTLVFKDQLYRLYLVLGFVTTITMAWTENTWLWAASRFIAGIAASGGMLLASALVLNWLLRHHHRPELGIHFSGVGAGIALISLAVMVMLEYHLDWAEQWELLSVVGIVLGLIAWFWMPRPDANPQNNTTTANLVDCPPSDKLQRLLLVAYFFAGIGYVVSMTFIVDLVEGMPELKGKGALSFLVVGLGAALAVFIWDRLARQYGYFNTLMLAYVIQVISILLPLNGDLWSTLIGALLFGATTIGCVSLVLTLCGRFYPTSPARLMGKMTLAYGVAQIIGPAVTGPLTEATGNYAYSLYFAAICVACGAIINALLIPLEKSEAALRR